jgi:hypothetical protein
MARLKDRRARLEGETTSLGGETSLEDETASLGGETTFSGGRAGNKSSFSISNRIRSLCWRALAASSCSVSSVSVSSVSLSRRGFLEAGSDISASPGRFLFPITLLAYCLRSVYGIKDSNLLFIPAVSFPTIPAARFASVSLTPKDRLQSFLKVPTSPA